VITQAKARKELDGLWALYRGISALHPGRALGGFQAIRDSAELIMVEGVGMMEDLQGSEKMEDMVDWLDEWSDGASEVMHEADRALDNVGDVIEIDEDEEEVESVIEEGMLQVEDSMDAMWVMTHHFPG
jgi:uncharacterized Ntn-hydrolase superfamily protein